MLQAEALRPLCSSFTPPPPPPLLAALNPKDGLLRVLFTPRRALTPAQQGHSSPPAATDTDFVPHPLYICLFVCHLQGDISTLADPSVVQKLLELRGK